ncbi:MAG: hypothetical protein ACPGVA_02290 [Pikeienuella sp.]
MKRLVPLAFLAACGPALTNPPANPPIAEEPTQRIFLAEGGTIRVEDDPYSRRPIRYADHDAYVTKISDKVALVVEPQLSAPAAVSNLLGAALVRRFQGQLPEAEALSAPRVFFIQPVLSAEATRQTGKMVVDWHLRTADRRDVGAVYATRRLSGQMTGTDPLTAFTVADAEHIALQTAAHLIDTPAISAAMRDAQTLAIISQTPAPAKRPARLGPAKTSPDASPLRAPAPASKPKRNGE